MLKIMDRSIKRQKCGQNMKQQVMGQMHGTRVESNGEGTQGIDNDQT